MPIARINSIDIWYETFGNKEHPTILLIMGACCQGIMWPTEFCMQLANTGFHVIRYDHRDTGQSMFFDFQKNPYTIHDMAKDSVALLDHLRIDEFQVVGLSLGAPIAELVSILSPEKTKAITLIASSCDFRPMNLAYAGLPPEQDSLSPTKDIYLKWMRKFMSSPPKNINEHVNLRVEGWKILNGMKVPFEDKIYTQLHSEFIQRARHPESHLNHMQICKQSEQIIKSIPSQVKVPTVIIHGTEDPIFPPDHGKALANQINNSEYILLEGFGHVPNKHFYAIYIEKIKNMQLLNS